MSAAHWLGNVAAWSAQAAALAFAGWLAVALWRMRTPRVRLAFWQILLALCLLLPVVEPRRDASEDDAGFTVTTSTLAVCRPAAGPRFPWREAALTLLAFGCAARVLALGVGFTKLRRWRRQAPDLPVPPSCSRWRDALAPQAQFRISP